LKKEFKKLKKKKRKRKIQGRIEGHWKGSHGGGPCKRIEELGGWGGWGGITFLVTSWWQRRRNGFTRRGIWRGFQNPAERMREEILWR